MMTDYGTCGIQKQIMPYTERKEIEAIGAGQDAWRFPIRDFGNRDREEKAERILGIKNSQNFGKEHQ